MWWEDIKAFSIHPVRDLNQPLRNRYAVFRHDYCPGSNFDAFIDWIDARGVEYHFHNPHRFIFSFDDEADALLMMLFHADCYDQEPYLDIEIIYGDGDQDFLDYYSELDDLLANDEDVVRELTYHRMWHPGNYRRVARKFDETKFRKRKLLTRLR